MLEFVPDLFIRIQFWRMGRKKEQPKLGAVRADKLMNHRGCVKRRSIGKDKQGARMTVQKLLEKLHIPFAINILFFQRVPPITVRGDDRQHVITAPLVADHHLRRLSYGSPGAARLRPDPPPASSSKAISAPIFAANRWILGKVTARNVATFARSCAAAR